VAALEHPRQWGGLIDVPALANDALADEVASLLADGREDQVAIRRSGTFGRRLRHAPATSVVRRWRPRGTVLVTGGTGGVGSHVARWLARGGAGHLVLISRGGPEAPGASELATELRELGARVTLIACDTADRHGLAEVLDAHPVDAVFHAAGAGDSAMLAEAGLDHLASVAAAKAVGAAYLDELTRERDLSAFVLFSSGAG